jgi:tetratricopeptide (TPR) repeat protein
MTMKTKRLLSFLALSLAVGAGAGCKNKNQDGTATPGGGRDVALNPKIAPAQAKADFAKVTKNYEAARASGKLSGAQCDSFSRDFKKIYKGYGKVMTIAWFNAGAVWEECGEVEKAEEIYLAIVKAVPNYDLAYNNLGVIYWNRKQESKALDYFKRAVKANNKTKAPRNNLAAALRDKYAASPQSEDFANAEREIQSVLAVDSSNRIAYENLARLYYDRGRLKDKSYLLLAQLVVTQANRVLKEDGLESADIYNIDGLLYMERDNQVDALKSFKKAAEIDANHADAHMNIAMISIWFRDYPQAEKSLTIALKDKRQRKNVETYLGLGVALRGLRKYPDAEKAFKKADSLAKNDPRALYNLGILYQEHIATAQEDFNKQPYETAKDYFRQFASRAGGSKGYAEAVADAKSRVTNIDQLFKDIEEMKKLEAEAKRLEAVQKKQEAEERKRLLDLEKKAKAAAGASASPPPPAAGAPKKADPPKK